MLGAARAFIFLSLFLWTGAFAQTTKTNSAQNKPLPNNLQTNYCPCHPCLLCAYNSSGRVEVKSPWDVYLSGSYILWQAREKGLDYATSYPSKYKHDIFPLHMNLDFVSGFKVAICSKFDHDAWTVVVEYARLHVKNSQSSYAPKKGYLIPTNIFYEGAEIDINTNNHASYARSRWNLCYDMIDLKFSRPEYVGTHLIFSPIFGARGGWIEQKLKTKADFTNLEDFQVGILEGKSHIRSSSWILGPKLGIDSSWLLGLGFKITGNFSTSLSYQYYKSSFKEKNYDPLKLLVINAKECFGHLTPNIDMSLGISWGSYFDKRQWHVEISVLYDLLYFWNQNFIRTLSDKVLRNAITKPSDLIFHGLTTSLRFDF